jgi:Zn-dependent M28 family amino/carboxypeptidase
VGGRQLTPEERADIRVNVDSLRTLRPARLDSINNGADDDGSGTVAVLEIAEALAGAQPKPARSILFVWHVAEELGLFGAQYFTDHPTVPRDSIVVQLNNDMIGRGGVGEELAGGPDYVQLIGWRRLSNELGDVIESVNKQQPLPFKFDLQYDAAGHAEQYYCRSDHYEYARFGIPIAFFSTGNHGDYHQVTDEPQYVDYTKLKNVAQLVHDIGVRVANLDHRLIVDGPKPDPKENCVQ